MKNVIIPLLLISVLFSASLSLVAMNHTDEMGHIQCPFAEVTNCAQVQSSLDFMTSHLNALSKLYSATPVNSFALSFSLILALALATFIGFNKKFESPPLQTTFFRSRLRESFISPNRILFNHWLSLHENSPASLVGR